MELILQFFKDATEGFWVFCGYLILISVTLHAICFIWGRFWRYWILRKHGYPPTHCDADGDFKEDD